MKVESFYDEDTATLSYVVYDQESKDAVIIDPVLDFDSASGNIFDHSAIKILQFVERNQLTPHFILETHAHADHLSSSQLLKSYFPQAKIGISKRITVVQDVFKSVFNLEDFTPDGKDFDYLIEDDVLFYAGRIPIYPIPTPGHTPACTSFLINDSLFTGDALFMPDYGTGRCDFPKGSAKDLYSSIMKLYQLPDETKVFVGHDYRPNNRELMFQTTIGESKKNNIQLKITTTSDDYISFRENRDKTLKAPRLLLPSLQINIAAGHLPKQEENSVSYLKLPLYPILTRGKL